MDQSPLRRTSLLISQSAARVVRVARFAQSESANGGVPDGRDARLEDKAVAGFDHQGLKMTYGFHTVWVVAGIAEGVQRHDEVHHGRIDGAQPFGVARAVQNPSLRLADGRTADALRAAGFPDFEHAIQVME